MSSKESRACHVSGPLMEDQQGSVERVEKRNPLRMFIDIALPVRKWARPEKLGEIFYMTYSYHESYLLLA